MNRMHRSFALRFPLLALVLALALSSGLSSSTLAAPLPEGGTDAADSTTSEVVIDIQLLNARKPMDGLVTGGQITREEMEAAAAKGYRTIINLRGPGEGGTWDEATRAEQLGMEYVAIPIAGADDLNEENARRLAEVLEDSKTLPAILHCGSGNRVGALLALKAYHVDGKSAEEALELGAKGGLTGLRPKVEQYLADHEP